MLAEAITRAFMFADTSVTAEITEVDRLDERMLTAAVDITDPTDENKAIAKGNHRCVDSQPDRLDHPTNILYRQVCNAVRLPADYVTVLTSRRSDDSIESDYGWPPDSLLHRLPPHLVRRLLDYGRPRTFAAREVLLRQGDAERHALLLTRGVVKVTVVGESGAESLLAIRRRGDVVGELAAVTGERRSASVTAVVGVAAQAVPGLVFARFVEDNPEAARELIRMEAHRLRWANHRRAEFAQLDARVRLARTLLDLAAIFREGGGSSTISLSQAELASLVGVRPATAEGALRELQELGAIEKHYRAVVVVDEARLHAETQPDH